MFDIQTQLFEGKDIRFGPIDQEKDSEIEFEVDAMIRISCA